MVPWGSVHKGKRSTHTVENKRVTYGLMYTFKHNAKAKPKSNTWVMAVPPSLFSRAGGGGPKNFPSSHRHASGHYTPMHTGTH